MFYKIWETLYNLDFVEWVIIGIIGLILMIIPIAFVGMAQEHKEFMEYCIEQGNTEQDCKWEWKRMQNGNKTTIMPIIMPTR